MSRPIEIDLQDIGAETHILGTESWIAESTLKEKKLDFIYDWLAKMWDYPCNYGFENTDVAKEMYDKCGAWCEDCDIHTAKDCWKKFLELKYQEHKREGDGE